MVTICVRGVAFSGTGGCGAESSVELTTAGGGAGGFLPGTSTMSAAATMASATAATLKRILLLLLNGPALLPVRAVQQQPQDALQPRRGGERKSRRPNSSQP